MAVRFGRVEIKELLDDLEAEYKTNARKSLNDLKRRLKLHVRPHFAGRRAASITTADFGNFISGRQDAGASNGEINRELAAIKRAYRLAVQGQKLAYRPIFRC